MWRDNETYDTLKKSPATSSGGSKVGLEALLSRLSTLAPVAPLKHELHPLLGEVDDASGEGGAGSLTGDQAVEFLMVLKG